MEIKILTDGKLEAFGKAIADALKAYTDGKAVKTWNPTCTLSSSTDNERNFTTNNNGNVESLNVGDVVTFTLSRDSFSAIVLRRSGSNAYCIASSGVTDYWMVTFSGNNGSAVKLASRMMLSQFASKTEVEAAKEKWIDVFMPFDTFIANEEVIDEANFSIEASLVNYTFDHIKNARGFRIYDAEYDGDYDLSNLCVIQAFRAYLSDDMAEDYFYGSYRGKSFVFEFNGTEITTHAKYDAPKTWEFTGDLYTSAPVAPSGFFANAKVGDRVAIWNDSNKKNLKYIGTVVGERAGSLKYICVIAGPTTYIFCVYSDNSVVGFMKGGTLANRQETLTQAQYDALTTKDANTTYFITE